VPIRADENALQRGKGGVGMLKALQNRTRDDRGFTLIELMVVVLIIAILIAIAIPTFLGMRRRAQDRAAQSNLRNGLTAAKAFYTDGDTFSGFLAEAPNVEASLVWTGAPAELGDLDATDRREVLVDDATTGNTVVLAAYSASGTFFCISETAGVVGYGEGANVGAVDAVEDCDDPASW
jgi:type IV pilus assembly protein PilA